MCSSHPPTIDSSSSPDQNSEEDRIWKEAAFPEYLQERSNGGEFCNILEDNARRENGVVVVGEHKKESSSVWRTICREAETDAKAEPLLSSFLYASILSHDSFERCIAFVLANRLSDATLLSTELFEVFYTVLKSNRHIAEAALADLVAVRERVRFFRFFLRRGVTRQYIHTHTHTNKQTKKQDPACESYSQALLYFKGYHAIQVQRIAHTLWHAGRRVMALALQSRASEVLAVDIHPAAKMGKGVLLDHGTGVVIGQTAEVGNYVSILQNVTLGGTGKETGDRHPKVSDNVLIGANATVLGNIRIGKGAQVAAGSLVLKPVPPHTMVAGSPAKEVGRVSGNPALKMDQWAEEARAAIPPTNVVVSPASALNGSARTENSSNGNGASSSSSNSNSKATSKIHAKRRDGNNGGDGKSAAVEGNWMASASSPAPSTSSDESNVKTRKGGPPATTEPVEAVTSDKAAKQKWGGAKKGGAGGDDIEYFL